MIPPQWHMLTWSIGHRGHIILQTSLPSAVVMVETTSKRNRILRHLKVKLMSKAI